MIFTVLDHESNNSTNAEVVMNVESSCYLTESFSEQGDDKLISDDESDIDMEFDEPDI